MTFAVHSSVQPERRLRRRQLMLARLNQVNGYRCLSESLAGFQAMQTFDQNKTLAIGPHENRRLLSFGQHALGKGLDLLRIERLTPLDGHIDILDCNHLLFHHLCCSSSKSVGSSLLT